MTRNTQQQVIEELQHLVWAIVAERYRERQDAGLTQKQLARRLGFSASRSRSG